MLSSTSVATVIVRPQVPGLPNAPTLGSKATANSWQTKMLTVFFVYVLLMNNGRYYIGQTREIHERLHEHRNGMSYQTRGSEPKLQWFTTVATRKEAADLEAELQRLNSNPAGRQEINRWVVDFKKLADELDYEPHNATSARTVQERRRPYGGITPPTQPRDGQNSRIANVLNALRRKSGS